MTETELNQLQQQGQVQVAETQTTDAVSEKLGPLNPDEYEAVLESIRRPRIYLTTAPTFTPKTFAESIQYVDDGVNQTVYFYFNGQWVGLSAPVASIPKMSYSDNFGDGGRVQQTLGGTGASFTFGSNGMILNTGLTAPAYCRGDWTVNDGSGNANLFKGSPTFRAAFTMQAVPTVGSLFMGIGTITVATTGHTFTSAHIGWKIVVTGSIAYLSCTQADGTTEQSQSLTPVAVNDHVEVIAIVNGTTSVTYYYRINGGTSLVGPVTLTGNVPTSATDILRFSMANDNATTQFKGAVTSMIYER